MENQQTGDLNGQTSHDQVDENNNGSTSSSTTTTTNHQARRIMSPLSLETISKIKHRGRPYKSGTQCFYRDKSCDGYGWLLPGWVAEERHIAETSRIYRYYYDPSGRRYQSQQEVINAWDELGIVVLDV